MDDKKVKLSQVIAIGGAFMGFVIGSSLHPGRNVCSTSQALV